MTSLFLILIMLNNSLIEKKPPLVMNCGELPCQEVLPDAVRFESIPDVPYWKGLDEEGNLVGWVVLSTDVVKIKAYSGQPLETLIGLNPEGIITGAQVLQHSEPILLVGIPEEKLHQFVAFYKDKPATQEIVVGNSTEPGHLSVDVISGATVTSLAQNRTILDTARALAAAVGIIETPPGVPGHFVDSGHIWSWQDMMSDHIFGHLTVTAEDMNQSPDPENKWFVDLYFTLIDSPDIGRSLLGEHDFAWLKSQMTDGDHLLLILGRGSNSFKGSGFVRGGIFDRVRIEQGLNTFFFRDTDHFNVTSNVAEGSPEFNEGGVFFVRGGKFDPGKTFDLIFLGSYYDLKGGFSRQFKEFRSSFRMPRSVYQLDGPDPDSMIWRAAWTSKKIQTFILGGWLLFVIFLFLQRSFLTGNMKRLKRLHVLVLIVSFTVVGLGLKSQPSITQVLTFIDSLVHKWDLNLFLSEPFLFIGWIFIAVTLLVWGRGVFCGWVCPYGALSELLFKIGLFLKIPQFELKDSWHNKLRWVRYFIFFGLIPAYLYSPQLGEHLAEIEPFKTTFFVIPWTRDWLFLGWWILLLVISLLMYRPFCRYLCPLGAALALPSSFRVSGPFRRQACSSCKICTKTCEPRAIRENGSIDPRECLSCMECETNYEDDKTCPPLIGLNRLSEKSQGNWTQRDHEREQMFLKGKMKV